MTKKLTYTLLAAVFLLAIALFFWNKMNGQKQFSWRENYREDSDAPYGSYVVRQLLDDYFPEKKCSNVTKTLTETLPKSGKGANYVFIGESIYLDSADLEALLAFVERGNKVLISSKDAPSDLLDAHLYFGGENCDFEYWEGYQAERDTAVALNLLHPNLVQKKPFVVKYVDNFRTAQYAWSYFEDGYFCSDAPAMTAIGTANYSGGEVANFVRLTYGEGAFYFHTTPLAFTNYHLKQKSGLQYASAVFSHLNEGNIYFDTYNHVANYSNSGNGADDMFQPVRLSDDSPLQYILSQPPLRWTWFLLLTLAVLYLIFRAKRRQRVIPILEENKNTSLQFVETVGSLYFLQNNHAKLCRQKMKLWFNFVRERYQIHLNEENLEQIPRLATVSGVAEQHLQTIFDLNKAYRTQPSVSETQLIALHQAIDFFYKNAK